MLSDSSAQRLMSPLCVQIGYWSERRGYVNTAVYKPVLEEFHGLQNRTYILTTILVRLGGKHATHTFPSPSCGSKIQKQKPRDPHVSTGSPLHDAEEEP